MRIVFCGNTFPDTNEFLRKALPFEADDEIITWSGDDLTTLPQNIDVLIPKMHRIDAPLLKAARCRLVQQFGVGLEGVDLEAASALNISVANVQAPGGNADSVAEHAILMTMALLRQLPRAQQNIRDGILGSPSGQMLAGRTVCLYGLGAVALPIAKRLHAFGVKLIGLTRDPQAAKVAEFGLEHCYSLDQKTECMQHTDILIVCAVMSPETKHSIAEKEIAALPAGALLVNIARGGVVHEQALINGLRSGHIGGAGLDVFWREPLDINHPLLRMDNVIATPHIAGVTTDSLRDIARGVAENINRLRTGAPLLNIANQAQTA